MRQSRTSTRKGEGGALMSCCFCIVLGKYNDFANLYFIFHFNSGYGIARIHWTLECVSTYHVNDVTEREREEEMGVYIRRIQLRLLKVKELVS